MSGDTPVPSKARPSAVKQISFGKWKRHPLGNERLRISEKTPWVLSPI